MNTTLSYSDFRPSNSSLQNLKIYTSVIAMHGYSSQWSVSIANEKEHTLRGKYYAHVMTTCYCF